MPDNLYLEEPGGGGSSALEFGTILGLGAADWWISRGLVSEERLAMGLGGARGVVGRRGPASARHAAMRTWEGRTAFGRWQSRSRALGRMSRAAWSGFLQPSGRTPGGWGPGLNLTPRFAQARRTLSAIPGLENVGRLGTAQALLRAPVAMGMSYYTVGFLLPLAAEGLVGGFNELARLGMNLRRAEPEISVAYRDMATRERAFTMRQASQMAIHTSQLGVRAALGDEASYLHG